jgi:Dolichyl-phosphate-mannose-protein mannosyltransferase
VTRPRQPPITPATTAAWRRRRESSAEPPPPRASEQPGNGLHPADGQPGSALRHVNGQSPSPANGQSPNGPSPANGQSPKRPSPANGQSPNGPSPANGQSPNGPSPANGPSPGEQSGNGRLRHVNEQPRNGLRIPAYAPGSRPPETAANGFAESQQAGLAAMISMAKASELSRPFSAITIPAPRGEPRASPAGQGSWASPAAVIDRPRVPASRAPLAPSPPADQEAPRSPGPTGRKGDWIARLPGVLPLVAILTVQAALSVRLIRQYTAFNDEALYLWAGHLEWAHWLHRAPVPLFQTYFSGAPVIYPPLGALADNIGGLTGARVLSLCFMLGATALLWATASRLYNRRAASFAAGLWAILGPTQHLGAYATYDAMALFLVALAAWFATGGRDKADATGWILAAAGTLVLANVTKYASVIFDPVVIGLAVASAWPHPGGKAALRRGTLLTVCMTGALALVIRLGGPLYLNGFDQATLDRAPNTSPVMTVVSQSWAWVGAVAALAAVAVVLSWRRPSFALTALLAVAVLLVPIEQARIHTTTSLNKHVDFGAWFAAIAAGYAISRIAALPRPRILRASLICGCVVGLFAASQAGALQAQKMLFGYWPNEARIIGALGPLTAHGGKFLSEGQYVPAYYLRSTVWQDWSDTRSVRIIGGRAISVPVGREGDPAVYKKLIAKHYFSVVLLTFTDTVTLDNAIARDLRETRGYQIADVIPFGPARHGAYTIWIYNPHLQRGPA